MDHPSYLFNAIKLMQKIDWSFSDSESFPNQFAIATSDAIYIFQSDTDSSPTYCLPLVYFTIELEDANSNILHISSHFQTFPVIQFHPIDQESSMDSIIFYTSSAWIEFDNKQIAIQWLDCIENSQFNLASIMKKKHYKKIFQQTER